MIGICSLQSSKSKAQEVYLFTEGTDATFYDQGIVDKSSQGSSTFEFTSPPNAPQYNDKVPCSTTAYKGTTSLKFNYTSATDGNWSVTIYRSDWSTADILTLDSLSFYIYSEEELPETGLPLIGIKANNVSGSGDAISQLYTVTNGGQGLVANTWTRITFPLNQVFDDPENSNLDFSEIKGIVFSQSEFNNTSRLILIDQISAFKNIEEIPVVENLTAIGYDSHAELSWTAPVDALAYRVYASYDNGQTFELRTETSENDYLDFVPEAGKNTTAVYRVVTVLQNQESEPVETSADIRDFTDDELLNMVEYYSFRYFWDGAHQATGMALERSNGSQTTAASGATGMGLMTLIAAHERVYKPQDEIKERILKILNFLSTCDRHHGAWSHWYNADTFKTIQFGEKDDGGDLVETSFVAQALVALRNYFTGSDEKSTQIRQQATQLWNEIDWNWYRQDGQNVLYWHWSPNYGFEKNMKITGWNEALITYLMAASSPTYAIDKDVYDQGWAQNGNIVSRRTYYNYEIKLAPNWGGPLFWIHYTHLGINPHGLTDQYADYWQEHVNTAKIQYAYAVQNPNGFKNYGGNCWGLTASDDPDGYTAHQPMTNDNGTISPTAALASMPYSPEESLRALKYFYRERGAELFGIYGPYDAFNDEQDWVQKAYIGIDQGPIAVMIENYRTGLLWNQVMADEDVQAGLEKLGFEYQIVTSSGELINQARELKIYPNPSTGTITIRLTDPKPNSPVWLKCYSMDGQLMMEGNKRIAGSEVSFNCSTLQNGIYLIWIQNADIQFTNKLIINK